MLDKMENDKTQSSIDDSLVRKCKKLTCLLIVDWLENYECEGPGDFLAEVRTPRIWL